MTSEHVASDTPLTVTISTEKNSKGVVSIYDEVAAVRALKVSRDRISGIPDEWKDGRGFYVLVSEVSNGKFHAYVGKATQNNFYTRLSSLSSHRRERGNWVTAFLFRRDTAESLNSINVSYVESSIYRVFDACSWISLINVKTDEGSPLLDHEVFYMNQVIKSALRILSIFGFNAEEDRKDSAAPTEQSSTRYYGVSILDLVRSSLLTKGEKAISLMDSIPANATIGDSGIVYHGKQGSPSGTAKEAKINAQAGRTIANGWTFWGVYRNFQWISLDEVRAYYLAQKELYENSPLTESNVSFEKFLRWAELSRQVTTGSATKTADLNPARHIDSRVKIYELVDAGLLEENMVLVSMDAGCPFEAVIANGGIAFNGNVYPDPRIAGKYARRTFEPNASAPDNGWEFWAVRQPDGQHIVFSQILDDFTRSIHS